MCQGYDQDADKYYKSIFRDENSVLRSWVPETIGILNSLCLVNLGIKADKKLPRESWMYYFNKVNLHRKHHVSFSQWCYRIKPFLHVGYSINQDTTLTICDKYDLLTNFWEVMVPARNKSVVEASESHGVSNFPFTW